MTDGDRVDPDDRPTAEEMLARIGGTTDRARGRLRVYLGMAPGVGKTFRMLEEGHRRTARGTDLVVGFVEAHGRPETEKLLAGLETVPRRRIEHRGVVIEEMDTDAILARAPAVALVDELAHTNAPGSARTKRWEDVDVLLDAGIDVVSTCNIQHLDSVADAVATITGAPVNERIPDEVLAAADEVELVDMSPFALRQRMRHGNVYPPDRTKIALDRFFTESNLTALRELSLRFVAGRVDAQLEGIGTPVIAQPVTERVLVLVDGLRGRAARPPPRGRSGRGPARAAARGRRGHARRRRRVVGADASAARAPRRRGRPRRGGPERRGLGPRRRDRRPGAPPARHPPRAAAIAPPARSSGSARGRSPSGSSSGCRRWRSRSWPTRRARPTRTASDGAD